MRIIIISQLGHASSVQPAWCMRYPEIYLGHLSLEAARGGKTSVLSPLLFCPSTVIQTSICLGNDTPYPQTQTTHTTTY